jgi:uracil-DNA glycosylase
VSEQTTALKALVKEIYACTACALHCEGRPVIASGPVDAEIMMIGEAPGYDEIRLGQPFVGRAGRFLNTDLLPAAGLNRGDLYVSNCVLHRPPGNRDPHPEEIEACRPWLDRQIELVDPKIIVLLGRFAVQTVLGIYEPMKDIGGRFLRKDGRLYMFSLHPAAALHQPANTGKIVAGFEDLGIVLAALRN